MATQIIKAFREDEADWKKQVTSLQDVVCHLLKRNEELRSAIRDLSAERGATEYLLGGRAIL
jgi:hypothetical protein